MLSFFSAFTVVHLFHYTAKKLVNDVTLHTVKSCLLPPAHHTYPKLRQLQEQGPRKFLQVVKINS